MLDLSFKKQYMNIGKDKILHNKEIKIDSVISKIDLYNDIARVMANKLIENSQNGKVTSFILPVGPIGQYKRFARICNMGKISCKNLLTINMDEYLDDNDNLIKQDHPLSFRGFMKNNLFDLLNDDSKINPQNIFFPDPENTGQIRKVIDEIGGVDICFGGIGINGHIVFNEPIDASLISNDERLN